jgi:uncharacterized repeat protein (TIGR04052 family)
MSRSLPPILVALGAAGCAGGASDGTPLQAVDLPFEARVGDAAMACGQPYDGVGTAQSQVELRFLRFYVSEVTLADEFGVASPVTLFPDGVWQQPGVGLLDLATDDGACADEDDAATNTLLHGAVAPGDYTALRFRLGVPPDLNHLDAEALVPPLDVPDMWWGWALGYRWLRLELTTPVHDTWNVHHGATGCEGTVDSGFSCAYGNDTWIELPFDPDSDKIVFDVGALLSGSDLEAELTDPLDTVVGCMSFADDPECAPIYERLGLIWESNEPGPPQAAFRSEPR